jgi:hypothetical protein
MDNAARLKKMHRLAKDYLRKHPNASYRTAQKKAGAELRGAKVSGRHKAGRKKVGTKPKFKVVHEVRRISGKTMGTMAEVKAYKKAGREILDTQLAWNLLAIESAKGVQEKKRLKKIKAELKKEIRALS